MGASYMAPSERGVTAAILTVGQVQRRQAFFREYMPRRPQPRGLIECPNMEMHSADDSPSQVNVDPHLAQKPRHRPGDELNRVI
jgi:hypothetical protein